ncbi:hypothetical protein FH972_025545 [Carpinus fangiana]|uniref:Glycoside hydrolase family 39 protein n=1 Tax=Carpinus fangiana TaxID=176857 RepID=A0A5N6L1X7_9ROSI|nr:hypothetical protein FH972_025545 [Carpinus fangiana]
MAIMHHECSQAKILALCIKALHLQTKKAHFCSIVQTMRLEMLLITFLSVSSAPLVLSAALGPRQSSDNTATVDLAVNRGTPEHLASGIIYGIPDTPNQIPDSFYTDVGFNYARAGGAQLPAPSRGWIWGLNEYQGRFESTFSNYETTRKYGGTFILLPHDLWGTDSTNSSTVWPGDNGDFSDYDAFLDKVIDDIKINNMIEGLVWDIWNEPDLSVFWQRDSSQWISLYVRTHERLSAQPTQTNSWWTDWLSAVQMNNVIPDQYSWHIEGNINDPIDDLGTNNSTLTEMLCNYGLPARQANINEYATFAEQVASGAAWWISRLERYDTIGLRGNWLSSSALHDFMASLLGKPNADNSDYDPRGTGYYPNGEYQVYKYYNQDMTGSRAATTGSGDRLMDVFATIGTDKIRVLAGTRLQQGTWFITVKGLTTVGLPESGSVVIHTLGFVDAGHYGEVSGSSDRGDILHTYSGDTLTFPVYQTAEDQFTAWAFEISL